MRAILAAVVLLIPLGLSGQGPSPDAKAEPTGKSVSAAAPSVSAPWGLQAPGPTQLTGKVGQLVVIDPKFTGEVDFILPPLLQSETASYRDLAAKRLVVAPPVAGVFEIHSIDYAKKTYATFRLVVEGPLPPGPGPGPAPPGPGPSPPTPLEAEVERFTRTTLQAGGQKPTAIAIAEVYSVVADDMAAGKTVPINMISILRVKTDAAIKDRLDKTAWLEWRQAIGDALTILQQLGALTTVDQHVSVLRQIAMGLRRAAQ